MVTGTFSTHTKTLSTLILIVIFLMGAGLVILSTRWGIGLSPDSVVYLGTAINLQAGKGLTVPFGSQMGEMLAHYPPLYSMLLAALGEPFQSARWLGAILWVGNVLVFWIGLHKITWFPVWLSLVVGLVPMLVSRVLLTIHVMAYSEPLFLLSGFTGLLLFTIGLERSRPDVLVLSGALMGLSTLTRFSGLAFLGTAFLVILIVRSKWPQKINQFLAVGFPGLLPISVWFLVLGFITGDSARNIGLHLPGLEQLRQAADTITTWFFVPVAAPFLLKIIVILLVVGMTFGLFLWKKLPGERTPLYVQVLGLFMISYLAFISLAFSLVDANIPMDDRILSPIYLAGFSLILAGISRCYLLAGVSQKKISLVLIGLIIIYTVAAVRSNAGLIQASYQKGIGFHNATWRESATLLALTQLPEDQIIYTNSPEAVYSLTRIAAYSVPKKIELMDRLPNPAYQTELAEMQKRITNQQGFVVLFDQVQGISLPKSDELQKSLNLQIFLDTPDGVIFYLPGS